LVVMGLLIGGAIVLAERDDAQVSPTIAPGTTSPSPLPLDRAQLAGSYRVTLVVRSARNLASLTGITPPVPGERRTVTWRFYPTCSQESAPCATSWEGRSHDLEPSGASWSAIIEGDSAPCLDGGRIDVPTNLRLRPRDGAFAPQGWVVRSFVGTSSVAFRCPGFAPSRGVVEVSAFRL
jgi:hypothetical protein